jgi:hypothetical protein
MALSSRKTIAMNMDNIDLEALQRDLEEFAKEREKRGWFRRNWLWFVPTLLLGIVVVGGAAGYWALFVRVYQLDVYKDAMKQIEADPKVKQALGDSIQPGKWPAPAARLEASEQDLRWPLQGTKTRAKAHLNAKLMQGKWELIQVDIVLEDGKHLNVALAADSANDAPSFSTAKPDDKKANEPSGPAPELNFEVPK